MLGLSGLLPPDATVGLSFYMCAGPTLSPLGSVATLRLLLARGGGDSGVSRWLGGTIGWADGFAAAVFSGSKMADSAAASSLMSTTTAVTGSGGGGGDIAIIAATSGTVVLAMVRQVVGLGLVCWGSLHQHRCHAILARLRLRARGPPGGSLGSGGPFSTDATDPARGGGAAAAARYRLPHGDWFDRPGLCCPHYTAELVIYAGLAVLLSWWPGRGWLPLTCSALNLSFSAARSHEWYGAKFKEDYAACGRYILVPYIY